MNEELLIHWMDIVRAVLTAENRIVARGLKPNRDTEDLELEADRWCRLVAEEILTTSNK